LWLDRDQVAAVLTRNAFDPEQVWLETRA